jgi:hypothetical protein
MKLWEWFKGLGRKQTPTDPDGKKHQLGFIAFCLALILVIVVLIAVKADSAEAAIQCRGPVSLTNTVGTYNVTLKANRWCYARDSQGTWRFTQQTSFSKTYSEGPIWSFVRWFPDKTQIGVATAPNGTAHVAYVARWVAAEFKLCVGVGPAQVCTHSTDGVRIWIWANGNYTLKDNLHGVPTSPMPRP